MLDARVRLHPQEHDDATNACLAELRSRGIFDPLMIAGVGLALIFWSLSLSRRDRGLAEFRKQRNALADCVLLAEPTKIRETSG